MLKPLFNGTGVMRVGALMSGSGSNLRKIIAHQQEGNYQVVVIFSDNKSSNAKQIGLENEIPVKEIDINEFYASIGKKKSDLANRPDYDKLVVNALLPFNLDLLAYCGYMSIASPALTKAFLGVNVHPADLSIEENGKRKFTGGHAVLDALKTGKKTISSTTHLVEEVVDGGRLLLLSKKMQVIWPNGIGELQAASENQERLKIQGDWVIYPKTLEFIAKKRLGQDEFGGIYLDKKSIPKGYRLEL